MLHNTANWKLLKFSFENSFYHCFFKVWFQKSYCFWKVRFQPPINALKASAVVVVRCVHHWLPVLSIHQSLASSHNRQNMGQIIMPVLRPLLCCSIQNTYFAVYGIGDILGDFPTRKYLIVGGPFRRLGDQGGVRFYLQCYFPRAVLLISYVAIWC